MELGAVGRALCILEELSKVKSSNLEALSKKTGLPKATALRMLTSLVEQGYVSKDNSDLYHLTLKMFTIGSRALGNIDLLDVASPVADRLRDETGETVHIGILDDNRAVYILKRESVHTLRMYSRVGRRLPLHCSAIGKCLLASQDPEAVYIYARDEGLAKYTPKTICTMNALEKELATVRAQGYAVDDEEHEEGIFCVGAPIRDTYGETVAAMSVSTPLFRLDRGRIPELVQLVKRESDAISKVLGYIEGK